MRKVISFIVSGIVAGVALYIFELIFNTVAKVLIATFESNPSPSALGYGADAALVVAAIFGFYIWIGMYRYMVTPNLM